MSRRSSTRTKSLSSLSAELAGRVVEGITQEAEDSLTLRFKDGGELVVSRAGEKLDAVLHVKAPEGRPRANGERPTARQREYLEFIKRYMHRYGVAPAETDIQQHFMVSAPSVNQMVRTLERRRFIVRRRDWSGQTVPRSIRVTWEG